MTENNAGGDNVLRQLRALRPLRPLSYEDALQRTELQANRLLALSGVATPSVPIDVVADLPRIRVRQAFDLPVSGSAHWSSGRWIITLNASEHALRQRFSLMHEFKHIIDHPTRHLLEAHPALSLDQQSERLADHFAACVLMPRAWVKSAFCSQTQNIKRLAELFDVSPKAMSVRLASLRLTMPLDRCASNPARVARRTRRYQREQSQLQGARP